MNPFDRMFEFELNRVNWKGIRISHGTAEGVPIALREIYYAQTPEAADAAYWKIENNAYVSGGLYEACLYMIKPILAAMVEGKRRIGGFQEVLFQIANGITSPEETESGNKDLAEQCRMEMVNGLELFYREWLTGDASYFDLIKLLESDRNRLDYMKAAVEKNG